MNKKQEIARLEQMLLDVRGRDEFERCNQCGRVMYNREMVWTTPVGAKWNENDVLGRVHAWYPVFRGTPLRQRVCGSHIIADPHGVPYHDR